MTHFLKPPIVNLAPGCFVVEQQGQQQYFTVLGSCVSLIVWYPPTRFYAMCHYISAKTPAGGDERSVNPLGKGKYGDQVLPHFLQVMLQQQLDWEQLQLTLTGGATSIASAGLSDYFQVAKCNIDYANQFLAQHQLKVMRRDVGGSCARRVIFNSMSGSVSIVTLPEVSR